jgi:uncharacterized protein YjbI with pentapeptide repeats
MNQSRFDRVVRVMADDAPRTRRTTFLTLAAALAGGAIVSDDAAAKKRRKRRKRRRTTAQTTCFGTLTCAYVGESHDYDDCNFAGSSVFKNGIGHGSAFRRTNFNGANLEGADLSGSKFLQADLRNANLRNVNIDGSVMDESCLFDADLTGANFSRLVPPLAKAYLCRTIVPEGVSVDRDCATAPPCCYT